MQVLGKLIFIVLGAATVVAAPADSGNDDGGDITFGFWYIWLGQTKHFGGTCVSSDGINDVAVIRAHGFKCKHASPDFFYRCINHEYTPEMLTALAKTLTCAPTQ